MEPKLLKTIHAEYVPARYNGVNASGWTPIGDLVLIKPDDIAQKTSGGIELPQEIAERMQLASVTGVIVDVGDDAFRWNMDRSRPWEGYKPKPGDRVIYEKYAGKPILGEDGEHYRFMDDKCIGGISNKA